MQSPGSQAGVAPVAPEHVNRLLVAMSPEGVFFSLEDLIAFVGKHALPFTEDLLHHMFTEANSSADGLMDVEQLGKATSFKFHNRQYNAEWARLCDLAPRAAGSRVTALSPRALEQEPIRANFEQEPQILTFSPLINERPGGLGATREFNMTASAASYSSAPRTFSSQGVFNTAHSLPPAAGGVPNLAAERAEEDKINRRMRPDGHMRAPAPAPAPPPAGVQVASFDTSGGGPPMRCGFDTCAAFDRSVEALQRVSDGVGWRIKGKTAVAAADAAAMPPPLLNGLHERDWLYLPGGKADHIPMRIDGQVSIAARIAPRRPSRRLCAGASADSACSLRVTLSALPSLLRRSGVRPASQRRRRYACLLVRTRDTDLPILAATTRRNIRRERAAARASRSVPSSRRRASSTASSRRAPRLTG